MESRAEKEHRYREHLAAQNPGRSRRQRGFPFARAGLIALAVAILFWAASLIAAQVAAAAFLQVISGEDAPAEVTAESLQLYDWLMIFYSLFAITGIAFLITAAIRKKKRKKEPQLTM